MTALGQLYTGDPKNIQLNEWRHVLDEQGEETGQIKRIHGRLAREVVTDLEYEMRKILVEAEYVSVGLSFRPQYHLAFRSERIPPHIWVACYVVTGANEGHYVHIDLIMDRNERLTLCTIKTFMGDDHAWTIARQAAELLEA
jgi:hypothetical protein